MILDLQLNNEYYYSCFLNCIESRASFTPNWKKSANGNYLYDEACEFPLADIKSYPNTNKDTCGDLCYSNGQCDHFYWGPGKTCYLRKGSGDPTSKTGARCGYIPYRPWNKDDNYSDILMWGNGCDFLGKDITTGTSDSWLKCARDCAYNSQCTHFTWNSSDKKCYQKRGEWSENKPNLLSTAQCGYYAKRLNID